MAGEPDLPSNGDTTTNTCGLFSQVLFHIVKSEHLPAADAIELKRSLEDNGAKEKASAEADGKFSLDGVTHIIAATPEFEFYDDAAEQMIPVVKPSWVKISLQKDRLANPVSHSPDPRLFFSGLVVYIVGLPEGDKDAIIGGVVAMGGLYSAAVSRLVTHIVTLSTAHQACQLAIAKRLDCKLVLPHWQVQPDFGLDKVTRLTVPRFDDCLRLGRRIDEGPYLLPDPELLKRDPNNPVKRNSRQDLQSDIPHTPGSLPSPPTSSTKRLSVFRGHKLRISDDLALSPRLRETIENIVQQGGGQLVEDIDEADTLVCQFRDGQDYHKAASQDKPVGNLSWLYHLMRQDAWTNPMKRLLHYPISREGLPGFKDYRISLSNYNGEARVFLENLAKAAGCEFTKTMKGNNTHLITAHQRSEKCEAAREWNINIVNHLWLEESYAKWQAQTLTDPRYTHFPACTNLGELVGQTPIDRKAIEVHFLAKGTTSPAYHTSAQRSSTQVKHGTTASEQERTPQKRSATPSKEDALPHRLKEDRSRTPTVFHKAKVNGAITADATERTPAPLKFESEGKENKTPSTGSRSAKQKAAARLHDMSSDIALYEKERKRVGGVLFGGKKSESDLVRPKLLKRSASADSDQMVGSGDDERQAKRAKKATAVPAMKLLVTGHARWVQDQKSFAKDKERLRQLGIDLKEDHDGCEFVAAPKILRTRKFICAMAHGPTILNTAFVEECLKENKLPRPEDFLLDDQEGERRYAVKLPQALERARRNEGMLLEGWTVYATDSVHGGFDTFRAIVEANGGSCVLYKGRAGCTFSGKDTGRGAVGSGYAYLISGATASEAKLWPKFENMARDAGMIPRIVKTDWMLDLALSQEIRWESRYELGSNGASSTK